MIGIWHLFVMAISTACEKQCWKAVPVPNWAYRDINRHDRDQATFRDVVPHSRAFNAAYLERAVSKRGAMPSIRASFDD
jgi:hypothetical protein